MLIFSIFINICKAHEEVSLP